MGYPSAGVEQKMYTGSFSQVLRLANTSVSFGTRGKFQLFCEVI